MKIFLQVRTSIWFLFTIFFISSSNFFFSFCLLLRLRANFSTTMRYSNIFYQTNLASRKDDRRRVKFVKAQESAESFGISLTHMIFFASSSRLSIIHFSCSETFTNITGKAKFGGFFGRSPITMSSLVTVEPKSFWNLRTIYINSIIIRHRVEFIWLDKENTLKMWQGNFLRRVYLPLRNSPEILRQNRKIRQVPSARVNHSGVCNLERVPCTCRWRRESDACGLCSEKKMWKDVFFAGKWSTIKCQVYCYLIIIWILILRF